MTTQLQNLKIYDENFNNLYEDPLRSFHNGHTGDSHEQIFYLRNQDASVWFKEITITPEWIGGYNDAGEFGTSGWGIKLVYGRRRPTEAEWDLVRAGDTVQIPDIGSTEAADTFTNHPVWVRIYCPGNEKAMIRENMQLRISYYVEQVLE